MSVIEVAVVIALFSAKSVLTWEYICISLKDHSPFHMYKNNTDQ